VDISTFVSILQEILSNLIGAVHAGNRLYQPGGDGTSGFADLFVAILFIFETIVGCLSLWGLWNAHRIIRIRGATRGAGIRPGRGFLVRIAIATLAGIDKRRAIALSRSRNQRIRQISSSGK
jgi:hypothetical protein